MSNFQNNKSNSTVNLAFTFAHSPFTILKYILPVIILLSLTGFSYAQSKPRIAVFAPIYLDSAFDSMDNYRYQKNQFPEFILPGLEFYEGAQLALDSLSKEGAKLEVFIYDTRSSSQSLAEQLNKTELDSVQLIIAHCSTNEVRFFAEAGLKRNIPVINVNLPNDGGVRNNPYYVMLNSTLKTQCEAMYRYMQKYYSTQPLVVFRRKGQMEDIIKNIFDEFGKATVSVPLKLQYVDLPDSFSVNQLTAHLDSNRQSLCVAGSLNDGFGRRLASQLASIRKSYNLTLMGMPTWDGIKDFSRSEFKDLEIIYCTPFFNTRTDAVSSSISNHFNTKMFARPSDMVMRGYEAIWRFGKLLLKYPTDLNSSITRKEFNVFREFDIQPVMTNSQTMTLDYFENKKLYFVRWVKGSVSVKS
ncbi:MAG TPA: amino acid ABC transporter substrate-binding protein [Chitinophagaceae bacterium]